MTKEDILGLAFDAGSLVALSGGIAGLVTHDKDKHDPLRAFASATWAATGAFYYLTILGKTIKDL